MVLFDRSWYNRAGVERVMGFCTDAQYDEFMATVNGFELALVRSGTILIKYWLDIADETQEERFQERIDDPRKRWKLSPMDLKARSKWVDYSQGSRRHAGAAPTPSTRPGTSSTATSSGTRASTPSRTCSARSPTRTSRPSSSSCRARQKAGDYQPPDYSGFNFVPAVWPKE